MRAAILIVTVLASGCAGTWGDRGLTATYAASSALVACDAGQTIWASDSGRWDRVAPNGQRLGELNPVLGQSPSPDTIAAIAVGHAVVGAVLLESNAPRWLKWAWFGGVAAAETVTITVNHRAGLGTCGLAGTSRGLTTEARR